MSEKTSPVMCPRCGTSLDDFKRTSLVGCANCYTAFCEEILKTVRFLQGRTVHTGKHPAANAQRNHDLVLEMEHLKMSIEEALKQKDFESAEKMSARLKEYTALLRGTEEKE